MPPFAVEYILLICSLSVASYHTVAIKAETCHFVYDFNSSARIVPSILGMLSTCLLSCRMTQWMDTEIRQRARAERRRPLEPSP